VIPLRDNIPHRTFPVVNAALIIANIAVFFYEIHLAQLNLLDRFLFTHGVVPARFALSHVASFSQLGDHLSLILSSMFLHGGWLHVLGNMLFLYIFGDNVEDKMGHVRYLAFYLLCGIAAALAHVFTNAHSNVPTIGASGAIAGVMGAYILLYPRARVLTILPLIFFFDIIEIPAFFFLGFWFIIQFFVGMFGLVGARQDFSGIAWWAHVGGFASGMLLLPLFLWRKRKKRASVFQD
jgi:membrane associated rhomboid family serine protease